jgi:hypothetical protein
MFGLIGQRGMTGELSRTRVALFRWRQSGGGEIRTCDQGLVSSGDERSPQFQDGNVWNLQAKIQAARFSAIGPEQRRNE